MLEAFTRGKLRGSVADDIRNRHGHKEIQEDLITSMVFGPLRYMSPESAWHIVKALFFPENSHNDIIPIAHEVLFWPSMNDGERRIEPDVIFEFRFKKEEPIGVIVEVKWNAPISERQLTRQWNAFKNHKLYGRRYQGFLGKNALSISTAKLEDKKSQSSVTQWRSWSEFISNTSIRIDTPAVRNWQESVTSLLSKLGLIPFSTFQLKEEKLLSCDSVIKWRVKNSPNFSLPPDTILHPIDLSSENFYHFNKRRD